MPRTTKKKKPVDLSFAFGLPPEAAMKYFRSKGYRLTGDWHEMLGEAHAKAFTVAQVARVDILQDLRGAVDQAIAGGQTFREFRKNLEPTLKKKGWWGKRKVTDKITGKVKTVQLGSPRRLKTIYRTNMKMAYAAGKEEQFQHNKKHRPYGQFIAILDPKTRDSHRRLHKKTFHLDDPFWDSFTPPLDFECRCSKRALSKRDIEKKGVKVLNSEGRMVREDQLVSKKTGELRKVNGYKLPGGGKVFPRVGFDNNPWKAAWQPDLDKYDYDIARRYIEGTITGPAFKRFFDGKSGRKVPVAAAGPETRKIVGAAKNQGVWLHADRKAHIRKGHPDITLSDFEKIQDIIENGEIITNPRGAADFLFFRKIEGVDYAIPLQVGKRQVNINSFYRAVLNPEKYRKEKRRLGKVLRKERKK